MNIIEKELCHLSLYIHIPFCVKKCDYCDFLSGPAKEEIKHQYFEALINEIRALKGRTSEYRVSTVFIGGGTPSCVDAGYIHEVMDAVREVFLLETDVFSKSKNIVQPEITIEVNPGTVERDKLLAYQKAGINRLSFGLQSTNNQELKLLGRIHTYEQFVDNYSIARELGFDNINIDLMSALPGQTLEAWEETLYKVLALNPEHISAYSLIIEEGTPFYEKYGDQGQLRKELPEEELDRRMYLRTKEILEEHGYHRYEISNYAKSGYESRHNMTYWTGGEYLGLGLGAASLIKNTRFHNITDLEEYNKLCGNPATKDVLNASYNIRRDLDRLSREQQMEEFMFLGLRLLKGISKSDFKNKFMTEIADIYGEIIDQLEKDKLLTVDEDRIALTDYGIDISNRVLAEFLLDK